ncbi:hypothetical protein HJB64_18825 [Rhizobium lentis]|nr:hypothetical protein [Rhizobium lentis]MBX5060417.1 hypothetical protein [Rhizobium lentis]
MSSLSCPHVVFLGAVFRQAWFVCGVHGATSQAGDMNIIGPPAPSRSGRRTEILKAIAGKEIRADIETDRKEVLEPETSSLRSRSTDCGGR